MALLALATLAACGNSNPPDIGRGQIPPAEQARAELENKRRLQGEVLVTKSEQISDSGLAAPFVVIGMGFDLVFVEPIANGWDRLRDDTPAHAARKILDINSADNRREGILRETDWDFGRREPYTHLYRNTATIDTDYSVRAAALRALNRSRDANAVPQFLTGLKDGETLVRLEAAKGLANVPDERALHDLIVHMQSDLNVDVRIACADALRNFKRAETARVLVQELTDSEFSVAWQARQSLRLMTGYDYRYDQAQWLNFLASGFKPAQ